MKMQVLEDIIHMPTTEFPTRYLGFPLMAGKILNEDCGMLLALLEKSLLRWNAEKLSYAGDGN